VTSVTPAKLDFSRADAKSYGEAMRAFSRFVWGACKSAAFIQRLCIDGGIDEYRKEGHSDVDVDAVVEVATSIEPPAPAPIVAETTGAAVTPTTTVSVTSAPVIPDVPLTDTFSDEEVRTLISAGNVDFRYDKFDFPADLISGVSHVAPGVLLPGLGLPAKDLYGGGFPGPLSADLLLQLAKMMVDAREMRIAELKQMDAATLE
jgi:hypothetical protein